MLSIFQRLAIIVGCLCLWQGLVTLDHLPDYLLPGPLQVFTTFYADRSLILQESLTTLAETLLGFFLGVSLGALVAISMRFCQPLARWLVPLSIVSQAIPTFAIAPLLVIWLGFGLASKIATSMLMIFFPVMSAFYDGLRRTPLAWLELAQTMQGKRWWIFWRIALPAALPQLATGIRIAAAIAPIGAIVGEWVGSSHGLGFLMLNANARMQIDLMFAALSVIIVMGLVLYITVDLCLRRFIWWEHAHT